MAITLLRLSGGRCSLEFGLGDFDRVAAALAQAFGTPQVEPHATLTVYRFGAVALTFQNEWDEPCLVSGCAAGDRMLEHLSGLLEQSR